MGVGDGVAATGVPRMTAPETLQREPRALDPAVVSNCGFGITGAAGIEAAVVTEEWADAVTIAPDKDDQDLAHCSTLFQCWSKKDRNCALNSRAALAYHHDIQAPKTVTVVPKTLAHYPFEAIAIDCGAGAARRHHQPEPRFFPGVGSGQHGERARCAA